MATEHEIIFDEATHTYLVDGVEVPSVTTILKPLTDRGYGKVNPSVLEYAKNRGKAVHEALELMDYGAEPEITPEIAPYINAYLEWSQIYRPKWIGVEQIVYSENYGYIGTLDRVGSLNNRELAVVDLKTSQPTKEALISVCCQTAAYEVAYNEAHGEFDPYLDMYIPLSRFGLFLKSDGTYRVVNCAEYESKNGFSGHQVFKRLLDTHKLITRILETKARGKGGE